MVSNGMLAAFVKVADTGSVSRAASDLGLGKSVISKRVAQLEQVVGATLFSRSTRRIALTPAGEAYVDFARRALTELAAGEERLRALRSELSGQIRLTAPVTWGMRVLAKLLPEFLRQHPGVEVEVQLADRLLDVAYERIDLALRWSTTPPAELSMVPVAHVGWLLAASPGYLAEAGAPQEPAQLAAHACLCYWREKTDSEWHLSRAANDAERVSVKINARYRIDNSEAAADAAVAGLGIAMLPDYLCEEHLALGRLLPVLPAWTPQTRFGSLIAAVATPERMRITRNRVLLDFLRQQLARP
jgi:DNA-binding transcriptional LysR family regulator